MDFEQDYIMRMIKQMIRALAVVIFGKTLFHPSGLSDLEGRGIQTRNSASCYLQ